MNDTLVFRCARCGGINRVPAARLSDAPKCGRCGSALQTEGRVIQVDDAELQRLIAKAPVPVLGDFWAPWCGPCRTMAPHLDAIAQRHRGRLIVAKVNTDEHPRMAASLGVQGIPTLVLWRDGELVGRHAGVLMGAQLESFVQQSKPPGN